MSELSDDTLLLKGRLQKEVALDALAHTGLSPKTEEELMASLATSDKLDGGCNQIFLPLHLSRGARAAIIVSLEKLVRDPDIEHYRRIGAETLLAIIQNNFNLHN